MTYEYAMKFKIVILSRFVGSVLISLLFTQCVTQEVKHELDKNVKVKGQTYARELEAQSPFKTVKISWSDASKLMKERNLKYRQAAIDKRNSAAKKGAVRNIGHEMRKSFTSSVKNTLNPSEIVKAMKDPVGAFPDQLESITDLKNISHSLTQSEWERVTKVVKAESVQRREMVNLHVLFCQSENIEKAEQELQKLIDSERLKETKEVMKELTNTQVILRKEREQWLDSVRDFFNAEYHDVEFKAYRDKLSFYRDIKDPKFSDWERWRVMEHSNTLAVEMKGKHDDDKPVLPGIYSLKEKLGVSKVRNKLTQEEMPSTDMVKEVRKMLRNWRLLKLVQQEIEEQELESIKSVNDEVLGVSDIKNVTVVYNLKKREIDHLKEFWLMDEQCWRS